MGAGLLWLQKNLCFMEGSFDFSANHPQNELFDF
jgi:hypothetical protein